MVTKIILECLHRSGINRIARLWPARHLLVVNFHRVRDEPSPFHEGVIEVNSRQFRQHLTWLARRADFVGENDLATLRPRARPQILLTFDDGYHDAHDVIAPILENLGIPAIFFVTSGIVDQRRLGAWDRIAYLVRQAGPRDFQFRGQNFPATSDSRNTYRALGLQSQNSLPDQGDAFVAELARCLDLAEPPPAEMSREILTWDQIRTLARRGFAIGAHGVSHRVLSSLPLEEQEDEIRASRRRLEEEGLRPRSFAFPFGSPESFSWETRQAAIAAGFEFIFSFSGFAPCLRGFDPTLIDRLPFKSSLAKYNFLLSFPGAHNFYQRWRRPEEE